MIKFTIDTPDEYIRFCVVTDFYIFCDSYNSITKRVTYDIMNEIASSNIWRIYDIV